MPQALDCCVVVIVVVVLALAFKLGILCLSSWSVFGCLSFRPCLVLIPV